MIALSNPLLFKSVLVAVAAGCFISLAYVGNGWTTIVLLVQRFQSLPTPTCADRLDQSIITTTPRPATGPVMQFNERYCRGGGGEAEFIKVRNISQECHQGSGDRMWEETEISDPQRMAVWLHAHYRQRAEIISNT